MNAQSRVEASSNVYAKIAAVQSALARTGIAKSRRNAQQGYSFRGIDEVYAALAPLLAEHGLCVLPRILTREVVERTTAKGGALFNVTVEAEFDFVSADDGSTHTVRTFGEAMDSADKATNKAMSAAYKYAALMAFAIPTEGDNDADATTHDLAAGGHSNGSAVSPPQHINDSQWAELVQMMEASGADVRAFCVAYGIDSLKVLPADAFPRAIAQLRKKLDQKVKEPAHVG
jgi:hypothetical protein